MLASLGDGSGGAMLSGRGGGGGGMLQNQQQSRLTQWISKDKEDGNEFSRAPGSASKPLVTSPNMNPLLSQSDGWVNKSFFRNLVGCKTVNSMIMKWIQLMRI